MDAARGLFDVCVHLGLSGGHGQADAALRHLDRGRVGDYIALGLRHPGVNAVSVNRQLSNATPVRVSSPVLAGNRLSNQRNVVRRVNDPCVVFFVVLRFRPSAAAGREARKRPENL